MLIFQNTICNQDYNNNNNPLSIKYIKKKERQKISQVTKSHKRGEIYFRTDLSGLKSKIQIKKYIYAQ